MKLSEVKIDVGRQEQGAWVSNLPDLGDLRVKVRGADNKDWRKLMARLVSAVPRAKRIGGRIDPEEMNAIITTVVINTGLLDWANLDGDDGKPLAYSKEVAEKLLADPAYSKFREGVVWACQIVFERDAADVETDAGN